MNLSEEPAAPALPSDPCPTGMPLSVPALEHLPAQNAAPSHPQSHPSPHGHCPRPFPRVCFLLCHLQPLCSQGPGPAQQHLTAGERDTHLLMPWVLEQVIPALPRAQAVPRGSFLPNYKGVALLFLSPSLAQRHGDGAQLTGRRGEWAWRRHTRLGARHP